MISKVLETIRKYELLKEGDRVVVGISGGADSVALLHCLAKGLPQYRLKLVACHVNHRLRGAESDRDEAFVRSLCSQYEIPCHVLSEDVAALAKERGTGIEECGRELRYRFFRETAAGYGEGTKIATAHTLSDQAETVLFRLARGTGLRGLCGIPPMRGAVVRPLLNVTRKEVERYCAENGLDFVADSSNADVSYSRNRLRLEVVPQLQKINPSFLGTLSGTVESLCEDDRFLWETAARRLCDADENEGYSALFVAKQPDSLRRRMLMLICRENGLRAGREKLKELDQIIQLNHGTINMSGRITATVEKNLLSFREKEAPVLFQAFPLETGMLTFPSGIAYNITIVPSGSLQENVNRNFATDILDCDKILGSITVRPRLPGDEMTLFRRGVTKSLKKLYNEAKIPVEKRGLLAVLADEQGVIWVEGFGPSRCASPDKETKRYLVIQKIEEN